MLFLILKIFKPNPSPAPSIQTNTILTPETHKLLETGSAAISNNVITVNEVLSTFSFFVLLLMFQDIKEVARDTKINVTMNFDELFKMNYVCYLNAFIRNRILP